MYKPSRSQTEILWLVDCLLVHGLDTSKQLPVQPVSAMAVVLLEGVGDELKVFAK
jgi:hypothetical protein